MIPSKSFTPDLKSAATKVAGNIEMIMASLYKLETSYINVCGSKKPLELQDPFTAIRKSLKDVWETLLAFFRKCVAFGGDVMILEKALGVESAADCLEFLGYMRTVVTCLLEDSNVIFQRSVAIREAFARQVPKLVILFRAVGKEEPNNKEATAQKVLQSQGPIVTRANQLTQAFVEANLAALRPNGLEALSATQNALESMSSVLASIIDFWQLMFENCQNFIAQASNKRLNITPEQAKLFADVWRGNQDGLMDAITSIAKSCDVILVEAVGAPPNRRMTLAHTNRLQNLHPHRIRSLPDVEPSPHDPPRCWHLFGMVFSINFFRSTGERK